MPFAIDANSSQSYYGEEVTLGVASPGPFYPLEPNSYGNWGVDTKTTNREILNIARQMQKGTITEKSVAAEFQTDYTQRNIARLLQGFFFSDVKDKPRTDPTNAAAIVVSAVSTTQFTLASALAAVQTKHILYARNFTNPANNGPMLVSAGGGTATITAAPLYGGATVVEAAPPATAALIAAGFRLSATATLSGLTTAPLVLTDTGGVDFTTLGLTVGEWLYVGDIGNAVAGSNFNFTGSTSALTIRGYARISAITATTLTFDFTTMLTGSDTAATTTAGVDIWFGSYISNQTTLATIKRRSYTLPRYLGKGLANANQLEVLLGCVPNKMTLNIPQANKITADISFVGINSSYQNAAMLAGTIAAQYNEVAINTSQDMFAQLLTVAGTESTSLFAYALDAKFELDNGANVARALGSAVGFDVMVGDFKANVSATAYFDDIAALLAVQANADIGFASIIAARNAGSVFDVPLLTMSGSPLKLEKDKKIMIDLSGMGAASAANYTASHTRFHYLPGPAISGYAGL